MNYQWTICLIKSIQITHYNIPKVSKSDFFYHMVIIYNDDFSSTHITFQNLR